MMGFLEQFDANHDGQIDAQEVQAAGPRAGFLEGMVRRAGIEPKYPIKLSAIQEGMQNARNNGNHGGGPFGPPGGNSDTSPNPGEPATNGDAKAAATAAPLVPGFGIEQKKAVVPGFEAVAKQNETVATSSSSSSGGEESSSADSSTKTRDKLTEAVRKNAEYVFKQNDKDRSGSLEKERGEWAELRGDPKAIDKNHNGVITLEEFMAFKLAENGVRPSRKHDFGNKPSTGPDQSDPLPMIGKTYRILSPIERLPEGLPDWFAPTTRTATGKYRWRNTPVTGPPPKPRILSVTI